MVTSSSVLSGKMSFPLPWLTLEGKQQLSNCSSEVGIYLNSSQVVGFQPLNQNKQKCKLFPNNNVFRSPAGLSGNPTKPTSKQKNTSGHGGETPKGMAGNKQDKQKAQIPGGGGSI